MSCEKSYAKIFPFDKMVSDMLNPEMIEGTAKSPNEAIKDKFRSNITKTKRGKERGRTIN